MFRKFYIKFEYLLLMAKHWIWIKKAKFLNNRIKKDKKKLESIHKKQGLPHKLNQQLVHELVFRDENTKKLAMQQLYDAHEILGNELFVPRTPLIENSKWEDIT